MSHYGNSEQPIKTGEERMKGEWRMKRIGSRKWFAVILVAVMFVMVLGGCGKKDISGTYTGTADMTEYMNHVMEDYNVELDDVSMNTTLELNSDNGDQTFTFTIDPASLITSMVTDSNMRKIVDGELASNGVTLSEDQYDTVAQYMGYDSYDDYINDQKAVIENMDISDFGLSEEDTTVTGTWTLSGNTITLTSTDEGDILIDTATLNNDGTISLTSEMEEDTTYTFDITFTKTDSQ